MNNIIQIGNLIKTEDQKNFKNPQTGRVYLDYGICPTLNTCGGGGLEPKVIIVNNCNNEKDRGTE